MSDETSQPETEPSLLFGAAEVDITPREPIPLAGFAVRTGPFKGVSHPLHLRAFAWSTPRPDGPATHDHALLIVADLLWWPPERIAALKQQIGDRWPVLPDHIILHATHTHGGPQTSAAFAPSLGMADEGYVALLEARLLEVIELAWTRRQPATIERGDGTSTIGINRRVLRGDQIMLGEDPDGPVDRDLTVLRVQSTTGATFAVLAHLACHPTTTQDPFVTADFPGVMAAEIARADASGAVVAFLQGCCGEINPHATRFRGQRPLGDADVEAIGLQLARDVRAVLHAPMRPVATGTIQAYRFTVPLPVQSVPTVEELTALRDEPGITGEWSRLLLTNPDRRQAEVPVELTWLSLGPELGFLAMGAEVTMPYGIAIKKLTDRTTLPLPYSNGMIGYVVTAQQLAEGGYEADESTPYFGLPSPFAPAIEQRILTAIDEAGRRHGFADNAATAM